VSTLYDREHPPRRHPHDDTAEIPTPATSPDDPDDRAGPTTRGRGLAVGLLLVPYTTANLGSAWLLFLAFLRLNLPVMLVMTGTLVWLMPTNVDLARWLARRGRDAQPPRASRFQSVVVSVLAAAYVYLLVDWLQYR